MTNKHDDLIKELELSFDEFSETDERHLLVSTSSYSVKFEKILRALRECGEEKFDVIEHLRGGGVCIDRDGFQYQLGQHTSLLMKTPNEHYFLTASSVNRATFFDQIVDGTVEAYEEPLPMPEYGKWYWCLILGIGSPEPLKYLRSGWKASNNFEGQTFDHDKGEPLRNDDNSLCECVKPDVKGGV